MRPIMQRRMMMPARAMRQYHGPSKRSMDEPMLTLEDGCPLGLSKPSTVLSFSTEPKLLIDKLLWIAFTEVSLRNTLKKGEN